MKMTTNYKELRTLHDSDHQNHFDRLRKQMQRSRTRLNSAPIVKKYTTKGNIKSKQNDIKTCKPLNYHSISLVHSITPINIKI